MLMVTVSIVTANAYYIHPIIGEVAESFNVGKAQIGLVPALNQLALALGILLLLPLGDRYSNKSLTIAFVSAQCLFMAGMALAGDFLLFTAASTLLGFVTIAPYLIPAYTSKRVAPERLGQVTSMLTAGVIFGMLVARVGAGFLAEHFGWRTVYYCAFVLMAGVTVMLPMTMRNAGEANRAAQSSYFELLKSVFTLARSNKDLLISASIQALNFAGFTITWLAVALHLTSDELGYGVDSVGLLAGISAISIFSTPRFGKWADRIGPRRARVYAAIVQLLGVLLLYPLGWNYWTLLVPLFIANLVGPTLDVTGRMTFLMLEPQIRTRLTTFYIMVMFLGGAIGSVLATGVYEWAGWAGTAIMMVFVSCLILILSVCAQRQWRTA